MISSTAVAHILGGPKILHSDVRSFRDLELLVASGLPSESLMKTVRYVVPDTDKRAQTRLADALVPRITRRRRTATLKLDESERVERLARIMALAEFVMEDHTEAQVFMAEPHAMLGERSPIEAAATELGARQVENILWKLEYSLPV